ncbi:hypothetical protein OH799_22245 [Nocardia sp. NBC_00881]|nr:hypothetical protein OH799_22245 [Nocardia sp. NBC_00881]
MMSDWRILWDPDRNLDEPQAMLQRDDGLWARIGYDGRAIDLDDTDLDR